MVRPRSIAAHSKVLEAAIQLFAEHGIDTTSMDAIAEKSGVSKATIYKHWPDKEALCLEVLSHLHGLDGDMPAFDSGDLRADLVSQLKYEPAPERRQLREKILPHLMAYAARNRVFGQQWRARVMERPRMRLTQILQRGIEQQILPTDMNLDVALALLLGPMLYGRIFINRVSTNLPNDFAQQVVNSFLAANILTNKPMQRN